MRRLQVGNVVKSPPYGAVTSRRFAALTRHLFIALLFTGLTAAVKATPTSGAVLPTDFVHDRIWLIPRLHGQELRFFTDTGGGWNAVSTQAASKHQLDTVEVEADGTTRQLAAWPVFDAGFAIPPAPRHFMGGRLIVTDDTQLSGKDGFLGGRWFADGLWELNYPKRLLRRLARLPDGPLGNSLKLGFQINKAGQRTMHFPSMPVSIDGETLDMLLDTGATATPTSTSAAVFGAPAGTDIGTSFIEHAVFERWRARHPNWRVVDAADRKGMQERRMIEVPHIEIAGQSVGPVWFSEQPAGTFQQSMASMMDRPTWGAVGGSAFKYFRIVIDYPGAVAYFDAQD